MKLSYMIPLLMCLLNNAGAKAQKPDYIYMVENAIKAPSGHNTQPWLFKLNENSIEIHPNFDKSLSVVDFDNRELFISLGCAAENLCIAAVCKGYIPTLSVDSKGIITINLSKTEIKIPDNKLIVQIDKRQTNRSVYNDKKVHKDTINLLANISLEQNIGMHFFENGTSAYDSIASYIEQGNRLQMTDKAFTAELKSWMRFNKKQSNKNRDGLSYAVYKAPNLPVFISKPIISSYLNAKAQNKGDIKKIKSSSHFVAFTTPNNTIEEWVNLGRSLQRFLLHSTQLGIAHAYVNQPCEVRELVGGLQQAVGIRNEHITILLRIGYAEPAPYSQRKSIEEVVL